MSAQSPVASSPPAADRLPRYEGRLQAVANGHVLGWCRQPDAPQERVQIAIAVDGTVVAEGLAEVSRPDLAEYGDGAYGFLIALPTSLQAPGHHRVLALAGPGQVPITAAASFWHEARSGSGWSDVVFEPGDPTPSETSLHNVPKPPASPDLRAVISDGWLFDVREFDPPSPTIPAALDACVLTLAATAQACAAAGLRYIPALIPAKRCVLGVAPPRERRWMADLKARLRDVDDVDIIDLLPVLRHAARHGATYHRTDPDWNVRGAFFVARALLKEAHKSAPALRPLAFTDLHLRPVADYRGALADVPLYEPRDGDLLACEMKVEAEDGAVIDASRLHALRMPVESHLAAVASTHLRVYTNSEIGEAAHIAIVGDAAAVSLVPWLAERAHRTTFFWSHALPLHELELELPPVVFHLIHEADLLRDEAKVWHESAPPLPATHRAAPPPPLATQGSITAENGPAAVAQIDSVLSPPAPELLRPPPGTVASPGDAEHMARTHSAEPLGDWTGTLDPRRPYAVLGAGLLAIGLLLMWLSRHFGFFQDEYAFILTRHAWNIDAFWLPHNGHLSVVPVTVYKLLFVTVGLHHTWPYRLILVSLHLLCVALVYVLAMRRVGRWPALIPAFLLLVLGSGYEDLLWAFQIGFLGSLAAGLGALLCLERHTRRADIAAGVLVAIGLGSSSVGLAIAVAILVELLVTRAEWRRLWIALGPLALYVLWYLHFGTNEASLANVPLIPLMDTEAAAYGFAAFGGLSVGYGQLMLAAAVGYLLFRGWRGRPFPALTIAGIAGALAFWTLIALTRAQYDEPGASRYVYPSAVFILIATIGVLEWRHFSPRSSALFGVVIAAAALSNLQPLLTYAQDRTDVDREVRLALGAAQMVGPAGSPSFQPDAHHLPFLHLGEYLTAVKDLGSPAFTVRQILAQPEEDRQLAENVLLNAESFPLVPPTAQTLLTAVPAPIHHERGLTVDQTKVGPNTTCTRLTPSSPEGFATFIVRPGQALYISMRGEGHVAIYVRRLARNFGPQPLHDLPTAGTPALVPFPNDASKLPWRVRLVPTTRTAVCLV
jgi:hypothetical protein